jgi:hypothetical protein
MGLQGKKCLHDQSDFCSLSCFVERFLYKINQSLEGQDINFRESKDNEKANRSPASGRFISLVMCPASEQVYSSTCTVKNECYVFITQNLQRNLQMQARRVE